MRDNIILCGFMGCGKSTVGRILAKLTGRKLIDTDLFIAEREGMAVSEIFRQKGEEYFRKLEHEVCCELGAEKCRVIATGGGALLNPDNVTALKQNGTVIYLKMPIETALQRLRNTTTRPLLMREDRDEYIKALLPQRDPLYAQAADFAVDATMAPDYVAFNIIKTVKIL